MLFILQSGIITSAIALAAVYFLNKHAQDVNIMGWYANYVIPLGAILVGLIAGSGYGIASWFTGAKISRGLLGAVVLLQTTAYFAAEYVEYREFRGMLEQFRNVIVTETGESFEIPGFVEYYQDKAESFAWQPKNGEGEGEPMGGWGYLFVGLGAIGFIAGGLIVPAALMAKPYCDACQTYKKTRNLGLLPASVAHRKVKKSDTEGQAAYVAEQAKAAEQGSEQLARLNELTTADDSAGYLAELNEYKGNQSDVKKLPRRIDISLQYCDTCHGGQLLYNVVTGTGDKATIEVLAAVPVSAAFTRALTT
jgi:hypothetical protein